MRRYLLCSCALIAALPLWTAWAGSGPSDKTVVVDFAVLPGQPLLQKPPHPQYAFTLQTAPGQPIRDLVGVANGSKTKSLTVRLSVSDARTSATGAGLSFSGTPHQLGRWTHLSTITVTVPPNAATVLPLIIRVPSSTAPGDYVGSIAATTVSGLDVMQNGTRTILHFTKRCIINLRVLGRASAGLQIMNVGLVSAKSAKKTPPLLAVTLKNTGTVIDRPTTSVMTFAGMGKTYTLHPVVGVVTGGATTTVGYDVSHAVPAGTYRVHMALSYLARPVYPGPYQGLQAAWTGTIVVPSKSAR